MEKELDITEIILSGDVDKIIGFLTLFKFLGFSRLYWDGYDSAIYLYIDREKNEEVISNEE